MPAEEAKAVHGMHLGACGSRGAWHVYSGPISACMHAVL